MEGCWFFLSPDRCENPGFNSLGHFSINDFWWQWCLKKPLSHPCPYALLLWPISVNFPGRWTLSNSRCEKTTLFSELFFRQIRSLLQHTMQPHKPSCWHNRREKAGWPAAGGTAREGKGLQRLHWAQQLCHWMPNHDCDDVTQLVLMPSDPTVTMFVASGWAHFNSKDCNIWGGTGNLVPDNELFLTES